MSRRDEAQAAAPGSPRLHRVVEGERTQLFTETLARPPSLYGERVRERPGRSLRFFDPFRSKLAAALIRDPRLRLPAPGERWLYLGAAGGTTASHVADIVAPSGEVYGVEKSPRPTLRLLELSGRMTNLLPILADARRPAEYQWLVPPVDGLYLDVAQPDQSRIALENARTFLRPGGSLLLFLKTSSLGRERSTESQLRAIVKELDRQFHLDPPLPLAPFHRSHLLLAGRSRAPTLAAPRVERPPAAGRILRPRRSRPEATRRVPRRGGLRL
ncbi:MAG: fibrillarin-like rRNA/tRNA 2'-O-methyltransferase [Thermoplasmata archaeon]|nr:fibrillarin-like rRNA/tRNA 2'-O-methyltransferase [Thermoplasmata archaeon]